MNMFKESDQKTIDGYIAAAPENRKQALQFLHEFIQKTAPSLKPFFANNMLGYGAFKYTNYKKEVVDWPVVALANQKNYISVYVCAVVDGQYLAEKYEDQLGKVSIGKSCIRLKKLEDLNLDGLSKVIHEAVKNPGF